MKSSILKNMSLFLLITFFTSSQINAQPSQEEINQLTTFEQKLLKLGNKLLKKSKIKIQKEKSRQFIIELYKKIEAIINEPEEDNEDKLLGGKIILAANDVFKKLNIEKGKFKIKLQNFVIKILRKTLNPSKILISPKISSLKLPSSTSKANLFIIMLSLLSTADAIFWMPEDVARQRQINRNGPPRNWFGATDVGMQGYAINYNQNNRIRDKAWGHSGDPTRGLPRY